MTPDDPKKVAERIVEQLANAGQIVGKYSKKTMAHTLDVSAEDAQAHRDISRAQDANEGRSLPSKLTSI